jgi:hypothetical protein
MFKQVTFLFLFAALMGGCATIRYPDGTKKRYIMPQVGVIVQVTNNCAPFLELSRVTEGVLVEDLAYGESRTVVLVSRPFSGHNRPLFLTAKGYNKVGEKREYLGVVVKSFSANTHQGTREDVWIVESLRGKGGCS